MSEYQNALPVRSINDPDGAILSKLVDFTDPAIGAKIDAQKLWVKSHLFDEDGNPFTGENTLPVYSGITSQGLYSALIVPSANAVEVKVGASPLVDRKIVMLSNTSGNRTFYWGFNNSVTTATGLPIYRDTEKTWSITSAVSIWVIADGGAANDARIAEAK